MTTRPLLSVACPSSGPLRRTAAILAAFRPVADELICFVNAALPEDEVATLDGVADRVVLYEQGPGFTIEQAIPWIYQACTSEWVFLVHNDEAPSARLIESLRSLPSTQLAAVLTTRRWSFQDVGHWIDESPWEPDIQLRLLRNDPTTMQFSRRRAHGGPVWLPPYRIRFDLPLYHLDNLLKPAELREAIAQINEGNESDVLLADGRSTNEVFYRAEKYATRPPAVVPAEDAAIISNILEATGDGDANIELAASAGTARFARHEGRTVVPWSEVISHWPGRELSDASYGGSVVVTGALTTASDLGTFTLDEERWLILEVTNTSSETWQFADRGPEVLLASRWEGDDGATEGKRMFLTSDIRPGERAIQLIPLRAPSTPGRFRVTVDLVHEGVRWFGCGTTWDVAVRA
jgi:hypothetical protein